MEDRIRIPDLEEQVLNQNQENSCSSTKCIAEAKHVGQVTVSKILQGKLLYLYHLWRVQGLIKADFLPRKVFCIWLKQICSEPTFSVYHTTHQ